MAETKATAQKAARPKTTQVQPKKATTKTPREPEIKARPEAWDDMEVLDLLAEVSSGDNTAATLAVPKLIKKMFDEENKKRLYDRVRTDDGRVPIGDVTQELLKIITAQGDQGKK